MMLHLIIEKPVEEVRDVVAAGEVRAADDLAQVEGRASRFAVRCDGPQRSLLRLRLLVGGRSRLYRNGAPTRLSYRR